MLISDVLPKASAAALLPQSMTSIMKATNLMMPRNIFNIMQKQQRTNQVLHKR